MIMKQEWGWVPSLPSISLFHMNERAVFPPRNLITYVLRQLRNSPRGDLSLQSFPCSPHAFPSASWASPSNLFARGIICTESAPLLGFDALARGSWVDICVFSTLDSTVYLFETVETMNEDIDNLKAVLLQTSSTIINGTRCILRHSPVMCTCTRTVGNNTFIFVSYFTTHSAL